MRTSKSKLSTTDSTSIPQPVRRSPTPQQPPGAQDSNDLNNNTKDASDPPDADHPAKIPKLDLSVLEKGRLTPKGSWWDL